METALIIAGSVIAGLLLIAFAVWAHQYTKVGPNEVLIISGRRAREAEVVEPALARAREILAVAEAQREEAAALGAGEADALRLRGLAEAETMAAKAKSWGEYNQAAITDRVLEI